MELRHIRYFVRAAELLHFTRAAESLYVSQPTLSAHIQQLEEELGIALFDRIGRSVQLTDAGKIFFDSSRLVLAKLESAREEIADLKALNQGIIRLGALLSFGPKWLPHWIATFHTVHPNIRINVSTGPSDFVEEELLRGGVDLGLSFTPASNEDLEGRSLMNEEVILVVDSKHALASQKTVSIEEIGKIPLALVSRRWSARRVYDAFFAKHNIHPNVLVESDDLSALMKIAGAGEVGVFIANMAAGEFPGLRKISIKNKPLNIDYGVLWNKHGHLSPAATAFLAHVSNCQSEPAAE